MALSASMVNATTAQIDVAVTWTTGLKFAFFFKLPFRTSNSTLNVGLIDFENRMCR
jgi:hypothetical protein